MQKFTNDCNITSDCYKHKQTHVYGVFQLVKLWTNSGCRLQHIKR